MTDIYVGHYQRSRVGCLLVLLLITAAAAAIVYFVWLRTPAGEKPESAQLPPEAAADASGAAPASAPAAADSAPRLLAEARRLQNEDKLQDARELGLKILEESQDAAARKSAEALLGEVGVALVFSPRSMPEKQDYRVQAGDSLDRLAKQFGTTVELIQKGNNLRGHIIREGDLLRILGGKFTLAADKTDNTLVLSLNDRFFKRYPCGTGQYGKTPVGGFVISDKIVNPPWWRPDGKLIPFGDTNNVLGTRWMALSDPAGAGPRGYGIHGTWEPDTIGKQASAGCIRLLNSDVEELFTIVPVGTPVAISE